VQPLPIWLSFNEAIYTVQRVSSFRNRILPPRALGEFGRRRECTYEQAVQDLLADLADGRLSSEGIDARYQPPEYVSLSDAWWADVLILYQEPESRAAEPVGRTVVYPRLSIVRRRFDRDNALEYRSVRVLVEEIDELYPVPNRDKIVRRTVSMTASFGSGGNERQAYRTGFAGRPSVKHLVAAEMERRAKSGELKESMRAEAKELAEWYARAHPAGPRVKAGTIRNSLADLHRQLKGQAAERHSGDFLSGPKSGTKLF
jgi:hypothetical protein